MNLPPQGTGSRITCEEAETLLPLVADNTLDAASDPGLFDHLAGCASCQESLARHDVVACVLAREGVGASTLRTVRVRLPWPWALATAAGLVVGVSGIWVGTHSGHIASPVSSPVTRASGMNRAPDTEVLRVESSDPRNPTYVLLQDGEAILIEPTRAPRRLGQRAPSQAVGNNRY